MTESNEIREADWTPSTIRRWLRSEAFRFPLILFLCTRAGLLASSYVGLILVPALYIHPEARQASLLNHPAFDGLCRWDCGWYERVANEGYLLPPTANVFPLFPLLGHIVEFTTGIHRVHALLGIANLASFLSYLVIYRLFRRTDGAAAARWALLLFAAYPFAFFQAAAYPESLMILGSAVALLLAFEKRHLLAGSALGLGIMARQLSVFGGAGMLVAQLRQRPTARQFLLNRSFFGLVIPFLYLAAFSFHLKMVRGDALAFIHARQDTAIWGPEVWYSVRQIWKLESFERNAEYFIYSIVALIPALGTILLLTRKKWAELAADAVVLMVVIVSVGGVGLGRYSASCWPAFLPLGVWLSRKPSWQGPMIGALFLFQGIFFFLYSHQFRIL